MDKYYLTLDIKHMSLWHLRFIGMQNQKFRIAACLSWLAMFVLPCATLSAVAALLTSHSFAMKSCGYCYLWQYKLWAVGLHPPYRVEYIHHLFCLQLVNDEHGSTAQPRLLCAIPKLNNIMVAVQINKYCVKVSTEHSHLRAICIGVSVFGDA